MPCITVNHVVALRKLLLRCLAHQPGCHSILNSHDDCFEFAGPVTPLVHSIVARLC